MDPVVGTEGRKVDGRPFSLPNMPSLAGLGRKGADEGIYGARLYRGKEQTSFKMSFGECPI